MSMQRVTWDPGELLKNFTHRSCRQYPQNQHMRGGVGGVLPLGTEGQDTGWVPVRKGKMDDAPV